MSMFEIPHYHINNQTLQSQQQQQQMQQQMQQQQQQQSQQQQLSSRAQQLKQHGDRLAFECSLTIQSTLSHTQQGVLLTNQHSQQCILLQQENRTRMQLVLKQCGELKETLEMIADNQSFPPLVAKQPEQL